MANVHFYGHGEEKFSCRVVTHTNDKGEISHWVEFYHGSDLVAIWPSKVATIDSIISSIKVMCVQYDADKESARVKLETNGSAPVTESVGRSGFDQWVDMGVEG